MVLFTPKTACDKPHVPEKPCQSFTPLSSRNKRKSSSLSHESESEEDDEVTVLSLEEFLSEKKKKEENPTTPDPKGFVVEPVPTGAAVVATMSTTTSTSLKPTDSELQTSQEAIAGWLRQIEQDRMKRSWSIHLETEHNTHCSSDSKDRDRLCSDEHFEQYQLLKERELKCWPPPCDFKGIGITELKRAILIDFWIQMGETPELKFTSLQTFALAVNYLDVTLSVLKEPISTKTFCVLGAACLMIALKHEGTDDSPYDLSFQQFIDASSFDGGLVTATHLKKMELFVLVDALEGMGSAVTPYQFLVRFLHLAGLDAPEHEQKLTYRAEYILSIVLTQAWYLQFKPSQLAAAVVAYVLGSGQKGQIEWSPWLQEATGYSKEDLSPLMSQIHEAHGRARMGPYKDSTSFLYQKYRTQVYHHIARRIPARTPAFA